MMMKTFFNLKSILFFKILLSSSAFSAILPHQGRVLISGEPFDGIGYFQFALVSQSGEFRWSHEGTTEQPIRDLQIGVRNGFYQVKLGDVSVHNMEPLPDELFVYDDPLSLRIWFSDGNSSISQLGPDQPLQIAPYAITTPWTKTDEIAYLLSEELQTQATEKGTTTSSLLERLVLIAANTPNTDFNGSIPLEMLLEGSTLVEYLKPSLVNPPSVPQSLGADGNLTLAAEFDGRFLEYEWQFASTIDGTAVPLGTSNSLTIENFNPEIHNGIYTVTARNDFGSVTSSVTVEIANP